MKQSEIVKSMIRNSPWTQEDVGKKMNPQLSQVAFARMLNNGNMTVNRLWEICEVLGYEIVVRPTKQKGGITYKVDGESKADRAVKINAAKSKEKKGDAEQCGFTE